MVPSAQAQPARQSDLPVHPAPAAVSSHRAHAHSYPLPAQVQQQQIVSAADTVVIPSRARAHSRSRPLPGVAQPPAGPPPPRQVGQVVHNADMAQQQGPLPRDQAALQTGQAAVPADPASVAAVRPAAPKPDLAAEPFSLKFSRFEDSADLLFFMGNIFCCLRHNEQPLEFLRQRFFPFDKRYSDRLPAALFRDNRPCSRRLRSW
eukprot:g38771.t1